MIDIFLAILMVSVVWSTGMPIFKVSGMGITGKLGLSLLLGSAISTFAVFVTYYFIFHFISLFQVLITLIAITAAEYALLVRIDKTFFSTLLNDIKYWFIGLLRILKSKSLSSLLAYILLFIIGFTLLTNFIQPVFDWDAIALYDFRARVIVDLGNFSETNPFFYFYQYPPYTSLLHAFIYLAGSTYSKIWYSLLFASLLAVMYALLRKEHTRTIALMLCTLLATIPMIFTHSYMAYTNLPYTIFFALGMMFLVRWIQYANLEYLYFGALLIGFSQWIRSAEPFWILGIVLIVIGSFKYFASWKHILVALLVLIALDYPWDLFVTSFIHSVPADRVDGSPVATIFSLNTVLGQIKDSLSFLFSTSIQQQMNLLIPAMLSAIILTLKRDVKRLWGYAAFLLLMSAFLTGMVVFSYMYQGWKDIPDSATRLGMILMPLLIFLLLPPSLKNTGD